MERNVKGNITACTDSAPHIVLEITANAETAAQLAAELNSLLAAYRCQIHGTPPPAPEPSSITAIRMTVGGIYGNILAAQNATLLNMRSALITLNEVME